MSVATGGQREPVVKQGNHPRSKGAGGVGLRDVLNMQRFVNAPFPLTPALSLGEREAHSPRLNRIRRSRSLELNGQQSSSAPLGRMAYFPPYHGFPLVTRGYFRIAPSGRRHGLDGVSPYRSYFRCLA